MVFTMHAFTRKRVYFAQYPNNPNRSLSSHFNTRFPAQVFATLLSDPPVFRAPHGPPTQPTVFPFYFTSTSGTVMTSYEDIPPFFEPRTLPPAVPNLLAQVGEELGPGFIRASQRSRVRVCSLCHSPKGGDQATATSALFKCNPAITLYRSSIERH